MRFLEGLSEDLRRTLLEQLRVLWTHGSTAIEGNTLTLGETAFVLREGLTVRGKPLKDHRDVEGHAGAVDLLLGWVQKTELLPEDLFALHTLIITDPVVDVYKPVGAWKVDNNSAAVTIHERLITIEFSDHWKVPELMGRWLQRMNQALQTPQEPEYILTTYTRLHVALVGIHPFYDGNGRMARLLANLPCLKSGYPPILIDKTRRYDYSTRLAEYMLVHGTPDRNTPLVVEDDRLDRIRSLYRDCWQASLALVEQAHALQREREKRFSNFFKGGGARRRR